MNRLGSDGWALVITAGLLLIRQAHSGVDLLSLLMLVPLLICLIPSLDSLQGTGTIRIWDRWRMRFIPLERTSRPWGYWINLVVSWPAAGFFAYALVFMPKR
jgi:hypothetical protein